MIFAVDAIPVLLVAGVTAFVVSTAAMVAETLSARRTAKLKVLAASARTTAIRPPASLPPADEQDLSPSAAALLDKARSNAASAVRAAAVDLDTFVDPALRDSARPGQLSSYTRSDSVDRIEVVPSAIGQVISDHLSPAEAAEFATFVADNDPERVASVLREWLSNDDPGASFNAPVVRDDRNRRGA